MEKAEIYNEKSLYLVPASKAAFDMTYTFNVFPQQLIQFSLFRPFFMVYCVAVVAGEGLTQPMLEFEK